MLFSYKNSLVGLFGLPAWNFQKGFNLRKLFILMFPDFDGSTTDVLRKICTPISMSVLLAEDMGFHAGDGHMSIESNGWGKKYRFSYSGDSRMDLDYFVNVLIPRKKKLFNLNVNYRKDPRSNSIEARFPSKKLLKFYAYLGLPIGKKKNLRVPKCIRDSGKEIQKAFLRGVADSDFSLTMKNRPNGLYPVLQLTSISFLFIEDAKLLLIKLGFRPISCVKNQFDERFGKVITTYILEMNGKNQTLKWMQEIGFSNKKHHLQFNRMGPVGFEPTTPTL